MSKLLTLQTLLILLKRFMERFMEKVNVKAPRKQTVLTSNSSHIGQKVLSIGVSVGLSYKGFQLNR